MLFGGVVFGLIFFVLSRGHRPATSSLAEYDVIRGVCWTGCVVCVLIVLDTFRVARVRLLDGELTYDSLLRRRHFPKADIAGAGLGPKPTAPRQWDRLYLRMKDGSTVWLDMFSYPPARANSGVPDPEHGTAEDMVDYIERWLSA